MSDGPTHAHISLLLDRSEYTTNQWCMRRLLASLLHKEGAGGKELTY